MAGLAAGAAVVVVVPEAGAVAGLADGVAVAVVVPDAGAVVGLAAGGAGSGAFLLPNTGDHANAIRGAKL